jgi:hypothetical protein
MKSVIYYDTELFDLTSQGDAKEAWRAVADKVIDGVLPMLIGGLDHISQTKNQVVFHDIGVNGRARDIIIRRSRGNT